MKGKLGPFLLYKVWFFCGVGVFESIRRSLPQVLGRLPFDLTGLGLGLSYGLKT